MISKNGLCKTTIKKPGGLATKKRVRKRRLQRAKKTRGKRKKHVRKGRLQRAKKTREKRKKHVRKGRLQRAKKTSEKRKKHKIKKMIFEAGLCKTRRTNISERY
jgi:hypothetical protein